MIKIKYPSDPIVRDKFESSYIDFLNIDKIKEKTINQLLDEVRWKEEKLNLKVLLTTPFETLQNIHNQISTDLDEHKGKELLSYLDYGTFQPKIADFFMKQTWINLDSCYYCNLDNIYSFTDSMDYSNALDFVNHANFDELQVIKDLGPNKADKIIKERSTKVFTDISSLPVSQKLKTRIQQFEFQKTHNHFTLDHFHFKDTYKFLSICLYNFVPSCYSCNSKFKKTLEISNNAGSNFVSPSSGVYGMDRQFSFKLRLHRPLDDISDLNHFSLVYGTEDKADVYYSFLKTFKILGRYTYHKKEALQLIKKKIEYPQSKIDEFVSMSGMSAEEIKKLLFGPELFEEEFSQKALVKFKRDIARELSIDGVID